MAMLEGQLFGPEPVNGFVLKSYDCCMHPTWTSENQMGKIVLVPLNNVQMGSLFLAVSF